MNRSRSEAGDAATELVLVVPVLMLLILTVVQFGVWYHAQHVTVAAAEEGARAARGEAATAQDGERVAEAFLAATGSEVVIQPEITSARDADTATVRVSGHATAVIPGLSLRVRAEATSPVETFRADLP